MATAPGLSLAGLWNLKAIKAITSTRSGLAPGCREPATTHHVLDAAGPRTRLSPAPQHTPVRGRAGCEAAVTGMRCLQPAATCFWCTPNGVLLSVGSAEALGHQLWPQRGSPHACCDKCAGQQDRLAQGCSTLVLFRGTLWGWVGPCWELPVSIRVSGAPGQLLVPCGDYGHSPSGSDPRVGGKKEQTLIWGATERGVGNGGVL